MHRAVLRFIREISKKSYYINIEISVCIYCNEIGNYSLVEIVEIYLGR